LTSRNASYTRTRTNFLPKNLKIKIQKTTVLVVSYECETLLEERTETEAIREQSAEFFNLNEMK
jgi:hypothetical protein